MHFIKNFDELAITPQRKTILELIETAFQSIQSSVVMEKHFTLQGDMLTIQGHTYDLKNFERIFFIGFGKGSSGIAKIVEQTLGSRITLGYDIDVVDESMDEIHYTKGTHPLPSEANIAYTETVLENITNLSAKDLVIVVICGGGSVLFEAPYKINLETLNNVNKVLLKSGATISEMNVIRKHLSRVKGGGLSKHLYPATVACMLFSDVPGNDLSVIASGPTVKDPTMMEEVKNVLEKYKILEQVHLQESDFTETATEDKYFEKVSNILLLSNLTAIHAMEEKAKELGVRTRMLSDKFQGDAKVVGKELLDAATVGELLLIGGETTVKVKGNGQGGRNQTLVLSSLPLVDEKTIIASFDSDGWDFYGFAGAIGDKETLKKAQVANIDSKTFLDNDDSYGFFEKVRDGILTGKLVSNVSDVMIVYKW